MEKLLDKVRLCIIHRRLPFRQFFGVGPVRRRWKKGLKKQLRTTHKIKVGFGPILSGEDDLNVRKWRIDPIVNYINKNSEKYFAGIFMDTKEAEQFDIIVIVKDTAIIDHKKIPALKQAGVKIVYDIVDQPYGQSMPGNLETDKIFELMDAIIVSSPLQEQDLADLGKITSLIEHPVINTLAKNYNNKAKGEIKIIWQGYSEHRKRLEFLHPIIKKISSELGKKISFTYHTNLLPRREGFVNFKTWTIHNWQSALTESDIAVEVKTSADPLLQRKPSTKALLYAAAGLPVVLTPSVADKTVVAHGETGYLAYTPDEWYFYLKKLAQDAGLRQSMGLLARERALENFSVNKIGSKYLDLLDKIG